MARSVVVVEVNGYEIAPRARLTKADLAGADLSGADLERAVLIQAELSETSKTPEERFDEHKNGIRDNKAARDHGRDLNYDLMKRIPQVRFKQDSKWLEAHAGEKLRDCGYKVEGAH